MPVSPILAKNRDLYRCISAILQSSRSTLFLSVVLCPYFSKDATVIQDKLLAKTKIGRTGFKTWQTQG